MLAMILNKKVVTLNAPKEDAKNFVLKVVGQDEFLVGDFPLIQFMYVQEALSKDVLPTLVTIYATSVPGII